MPAVSSRQRLRLFTQALFAALVVASAPAWADVSRDDAAAAAQQMTGGRVLSVEKAGGGRPAWRVKVVTSRGEVRVIHIDAATGQAN